MNENIVLTIVIPIYNVARYLCNGLDSIFYQWSDKLEVIAVDDGSTDGSGAILDDYMARCRRSGAKIIHKVNQGVCVARNAGIELARGEFITFMDPDDAYVDGAIPYLLEALERTKADIVCFNEQVVDDQKKPVLLVPGIVTVMDMNDKRQAKVAVKSIYPIAWNSCYRRKQFNEVRFNPQIAQSSEDAVYGFSCLCRAGQIEKHSTVLYKYFQRPNSCVHTPSEKRIRGYIDSSKYILEEAEKWKWYVECKYIIFRKLRVQAICEAVHAIRQLPKMAQKLIWGYYFEKLSPIFERCGIVPILQCPLYWIAFKCKSAILVTWVLYMPYMSLRFMLKSRLICQMWQVIR